MTAEVIVADKWPEAVSDGLALPCGICGLTPNFDYLVDHDIWRELAPAELRLSVICLPCLDRLGRSRGIHVGRRIQEVQFVGSGHTTILKPERVVIWPSAAAAKGEGDDG